MPQVFKIGGYWVYIWSNEGDPIEPIHVHVSKGSPVPNSTKIWITSTHKCLVANNNSKIPEQTLKNIMRVIEAQVDDVVDKWKSTFDVEIIRYYC